MTPGQYLAEKRARAGLSLIELARLVEPRWPGSAVAALQGIEADEPGETVLIASVIGTVLPGFDLLHFLMLAEATCSDELGEVA